MYNSENQNHLICSANYLDASGIKSHGYQQPSHFVSITLQKDSAIEVGKINISENNNTSTPTPQPEVQKSHPPLISDMKIPEVIFMIGSNEKLSNEGKSASGSDHLFLGAPDDFVEAHFEEPDPKRPFQFKFFNLSRQHSTDMSVGNSPKLGPNSLHKSISELNLPTVPDEIISRNSSSFDSVSKIFSKGMIGQMFPSKNGHSDSEDSPNIKRSDSRTHKHSLKSGIEESNEAVETNDNSRSSSDASLNDGRKKGILAPIRSLLKSPKPKRKDGSKVIDDDAISSTSSSRAQFETHSMSEYRITKVIGRGASGVVRLARRGSSDKVYAIKHFRKKRKDEPYREYIKKLTSEFCIGSMLHHTNVVETIDIIREGSSWYEVLEYCVGGDLYSIIKNGQMTVIEINCCFKQLLHGVQYLHSVGVAHRDLKPENLLIDQYGHLKITDFGVSEVFRVCWEKKPHMSHGVCGSTPYIAPEVFSFEEYDARIVDIWSCGIIYYGMVFRGIPWSKASIEDENYQYFLLHRGVQYEPLVRLLPGAQQLMYRILEPEPKKRISVFEITENDWFKSIEVCIDGKEHNHLAEPF